VNICPVAVLPFAMPCVVPAVALLSSLEHIFALCKGVAGSATRLDATLPGRSSSESVNMCVILCDLSAEPQQLPLLCCYAARDVLKFVALVQRETQEFLQGLFLNARAALGALKLVLSLSGCLR